MQNALKEETIQVADKKVHINAATLQKLLGVILAAEDRLEVV